MFVRGVVFVSSSSMSIRSNNDSLEPDCPPDGLYDGGLLYVPVSTSPSVSVSPSVSMSASAAYLIANGLGGILMSFRCMSIDLGVFGRLVCVAVSLSCGRERFVLRLCA